MATVLIVPTDHLIGGLLGQLTDLAGHAAQFQPDDEEPSQSVRALRPDVVMLDAACGRRLIDATARAAADVGARIVYFAASMGSGELRRFALERGAKYFALPAGPKLLGRVLASALSDDATAAHENGRLPSGQDAVAAALAAVSRARASADRSAALKTINRALRTEHELALAECRRSYAGLREAVIAYTRELRGAGVPPDRTLEIIKTAVRADDAPDSPKSSIASDLNDATEWCLQAYYAA
jgi:DNA-binding response OmpR family regulator